MVFVSDVCETALTPSRRGTRFLTGLQGAPGEDNERGGLELDSSFLDGCASRSFSRARGDVAVDIQRSAEVHSFGGCVR